MMVGFWQEKKEGKKNFKKKEKRKKEKERKSLLVQFFHQDQTQKAIVLDVIYNKHWDLDLEFGTEQPHSFNQQLD